MKKLLRSERVQAALAFLTSLFIGATLASIRWRFENREPVDAAADLPPGAVACFWHGRLIHGVVCKRVLKKKDTRVIVSRSRDGEFITRAVMRLGFPALRGSADGGATGGDKGGAKVLVEAVRHVRRGGVVAITPDGPRGPARKIPDGPVQLARLSGADIYLFGLAARPAIRLKTWDGMQIPLPFGRGCVVFDGPIAAPARDADAEALDGARQDWERRLNAAQERAEALLAGGG